MSCDCPKCTPEAAEARETSRRLIGELRKQRDELLEACKDLLICATTACGVCPINCGPGRNDPMDRARAAIAKAEGGGK